MISIERIKEDEPNNRHSSRVPAPEQSIVRVFTLSFEYECINSLDEARAPPVRSLSLV